MPHHIRKGESSEVGDSLTILGCGEAFDHRFPNTSLLLRTEQSTVLLDCGYMVPPSVWSVLEQDESLNGIWISHFHADHAMGLPALLGRMWEEGRKRELAVFGAKGCRERVISLLETGYPSLTGKLQFELVEVAVEPGEPATWGDLRFESAETEHGARNLAVRIGTREGILMAYSGDGKPTSESAALGRNTFWVQECYSAEKELPGHASLKKLLDLLPQINPTMLALAHVARSERESVEHEVETAAAAGVPVCLLAPGQQHRLQAVDDRSQRRYARRMESNVEITMDASQLITFLNSIGVGDMDKVSAKLEEAGKACVQIGQPDLADRLGSAREALLNADAKTYRKHVEAVVSKLGHIR